jgi:sugar O-acyltransferase (sialic acid O-acetyltransferase NeuD family)
MIGYVDDCAEAGSLAPVGGYLDDAGDVLARFDYDVPWLGSIEEFQPQEGDGFILAVGTPAGKRVILERLRGRGGSFPNMIHPSARLPRTTRLGGEGVIICIGAVIGPDTSIERFVTINASSGTGHDVTIGEFATIGANVTITGNARVEADAVVGTGVVLLPKVKVGVGANIGAGAIVYRSVKAGTTVYAPPAKLLKLK